MNRYLSLIVIVFSSIGNLFAQGDPKPAWAVNVPSPPQNANYVFVVGMGIGNNEQTAIAAAWADADIKSSHEIGAVIIPSQDINVTTLKKTIKTQNGLQEKIMCTSSPIYLSKNEVKVYVLVQKQVDYNVSVDFDSDGGINCTDENFEKKVAKFNKKNRDKQTIPNWFEESNRNLNYPQEKYISGFVMGIFEEDNLGMALENMKKSAVEELVSSISVKVECNSLFVPNNSKKSNNIAINQMFTDTANIANEMEINGLKMEAWYNTSTNEIAGFAYIRKTEFAEICQKYITSNLYKIEILMQTVSQLQTNGLKGQAQELSESAIELMTLIENYQRILILVDDGECNIGLQLEKTAQIKKQLIEIRSSLYQGITICIKTTENNFGSQENVLNLKLQSLLAEKCSFVEKDQQADYTLTVAANMREGAQGGTIIYIFADVELTLFDNLKQQIIYSDAFLINGGGLSFQSAGREILKNDIPDNIFTKIIPYIK